MNKKRGINKKGQNQISFGMIFSIILIIVFITFAIFGIKKFLETNSIIQVEKFKSDFQEDVNDMWKSTQGSDTFEYFLPNKIEQVCFHDGEFGNVYFMPEGKYDEDTLNNIDIAKTIASSPSRPKKLCIDTEGGKISLTIKKAYNENLVTITR